MSDFRIRPITRSEAQRAVDEWHSHNDPHVADRFCLGAFVQGELVAVSVLASPVAQALDDGTAWEVKRLAVGPSAPKFTCSRLLGATTRVGLAAGLDLIVSYTRIDERGTCYRACNWTPVAVSKGRPHDTGNRKGRWLPGLEDTRKRKRNETIDHVRWEVGPLAGAVGVEWKDGRMVAIGKAA